MEYIILQGIKLEDFLYKVEKTIEQKVNEKIESLQSKPAVTYMTRKEAAKFLGVSLVTLYIWCKSGLLTSYRIGKMVRFRSDEIEAAFTKRDYGRRRR